MSYLLDTNTVRAERSWSGNAQDFKFYVVEFQ
jgi:hypothetical protein